MKKILAKNPRLTLDATSYRDLQRQVLERDGWRCQVCGSMQNLQVHHLKFRSQSGGDEEQNLVTLCVECHAQISRHTLVFTVFSIGIAGPDDTILQCHEQASRYRVSEVVELKN